MWGLDSKAIALFLFLLFAIASNIAVLLNSDSVDLEELGSKHHQSKTVESKIVEQKAVEKKAVEQKPVESKIVEQKTVDQKPLEQKPVEQKLVEEKPVESKTVEQKTVDQKPLLESKIVEQQPIEQKSVKQKIRKNAIFFNSFVNKPNETDSSESRRWKRNKFKVIIKEQLALIKAQPLLDGANIFYTRFGDLDVSWPECGGTISGNRTCIELAAQETGGEDITLQHLYEYCTENPLDRVLYMHSKGTFTASKENDYLRDILMKAVTSDECVGMSDNGVCSSCSSKFAPFHSVSMREICGFRTASM